MKTQALKTPTTPAHYHKVTPDWVFKSAIGDYHGRKHGPKRRWFAPEGQLFILDGVASIVVNVTTLSLVSTARKSAHGRSWYHRWQEASGRHAGHDKVDCPIIEKKTAQVLSVNNGVANVMDSETYETFDLPVPEELKDQCVEAAMCFTDHS